jgi:hypothetical protein
VERVAREYVNIYRRLPGIRTAKRNGELAKWSVTFGASINLAGRRLASAEAPLTAIGEPRRNRRNRSPWSESAGDGTVLWASSEHRFQPHSGLAHADANRLPLSFLAQGNWVLPQPTRLPGATAPTTGRWPRPADAAPMAPMARYPPLCW